MDLVELRRSTVGILERSDFSLSTISGPPEMSFDLVARRDDTLLILRTITSRDQIRSRASSELKVLAGVLSGSPMIIHPSRTDPNYQDGVLYIIMGIPLMTINTLREYLVEDVPPMVYYSSGGHFVSINGNLLRESREAQGISIGALANAIGVSRRAVQMYENGMGVDIEMALRLEDTMGRELILPLDPFSKGEELERIREEMSLKNGPNKEILDHLDSIGMEVIPTIGCPFDALARHGDDLLLTSIGCNNDEIHNIGRTLSRITRVTGNESFLVATRAVKGRNIGGTPVLSVKDVKKAESTEDLIEMIRRRTVARS